MRPAEDAANEKLTRTSVSFFGLFFFFSSTSRETGLVTAAYHSSDLSSPESEDKSKQTGNLHMRLLID